MDEISEIKNEKRILDAIDQLRRRKARPDVDRICNYMMRKFLIDPGETVADLERLVDADVVIKVEYKGNTSYRNAAKWSRYALYKNRPETASLLTLNSERMSALFATALTELSSRDTTPATGVSYSEIEAYLQRKDAHFSKKLLDFMILRELNAGNILRLRNGNFVVTAAGKDRSTNADNIKTEEKDVVKENEEEEEEKHHVEESENANNTNKTPNKSNIVNGKSGDAQNSNVGESGAITVSGFRIGVRRKRAKIVFDPSDHRAPAPRKRGRPAGSSNKNNHHQHHNSVHIHHSNNSSNNHSHISSSSNSSNSSTNGSHGLGGISLGVTGRHQLDLKDQIFKAHRPSSVVQPQTNNDNKRASIVCVEEHCYVCGQGSNCRGNTERLIDCRDCVTNKVHPSCLEQQNGGISGMDGDSSGRNIGHSSAQSWQCTDCRSCCICGGVSDSSSMVSCDGCEEWYHIYCHTPVLHERPRGGKWLCQQCLQDRTAYAHSVNGVGGLPTPRESPIPESSQPHVDNGVCENGIVDIDSVDTKHSACIDHGDPENKNTLSTPVKQKPAPDASNWTPVDVELYFRSVGFAEQAHVFRDQEIDGKSLLLMKRSDVLTGLGLKLGPALKMYTHVRRLQLRQHDDMAASDFMWT